MSGGPGKSVPLRLKLYFYYIILFSGNVHVIYDIQIHQMHHYVPLGMRLQSTYLLKRTK